MSETPVKKTKNVTPEKVFRYQVVTMLIYYRHEDQAAEQYMNVIYANEDAVITKTQLSDIHVSAMQQFCTRKEKTPDDVLDMVFINVSPIGAMSAKTFHGKDYVEPENES